MKFSTGNLLQLESYVKLVEVIRLCKEMKPQITVPAAIIFNPAYSTY